MRPGDVIDVQSGLRKVNDLGVGWGWIWNEGGIIILVCVCAWKGLDRGVLGFRRKLIQCQTHYVSVHFVGFGPHPNSHRCDIILFISFNLKAVVGFPVV